MAQNTYEIPINTNINQILNQPEKFIVPDVDLEKQLIKITKELFDFGVKKEINSSCPLDELFIDGFDNEQIWEEIQLQNIPLIEQFKNASDDIIENDLEELENMDEEQDEMLDSEDNDNDDTLDMDEMDEESNDEDNNDETMVENDEENEEEDDNDLEEDIMDDLDKPGDSKSGKRQRTIVDDNFFSLRDMEAFAEEYERKDYKRSMKSGNENEEDEEEEEEEFIDLDQDLSDEDDMDIKYEDFFDPPDDFKKENDQKADEDKKDEKTSDDEDNDEDDDEDDDSEDDEDEDDEDGEDEDENENNLTSKVSNLFEINDDEVEEKDEKSTFEKNQEKLQETIKKLEEEAIADKHWALKGEVDAKNRPLNSLLEEDLEVEHASKPVPVITEETTETLEDMIRRRILENLFDDVERKIDVNTLKPKYDPNKQFELFEEQKKQSLSEVYENEYLRQTAGTHQSEKELELEKRHQEIDEIFKKLCQNLDALSNWHYAPKPAKMEMSVVTNAPAIEMEEIVPIHVSDSTLIAPEEAYEKPKTDVKGETEIDSSEKKRQRSRRKKIKKVERKQREKEQQLRAKLLPSSISQKHANKKQALESLTSNKNVTIISNTMQTSGNKKKNNAKVISTNGNSNSRNTTSENPTMFKL